MPVQPTVNAILEAGRKLLLERGGEGGAVDMGVRLKDAIAKAGVATSTGYRLFAGEAAGPQSVFSAALLKSLIVDGEHTNPVETIATAGRVISEHQAVFDHGTPDELAAVLRETIRQVGNANIEALANSVNMRAYVVALATAAPAVTEGPDTDDDLSDAFREAEMQKSNFVDAYEQVATLFGLRLRAGWTWEAVDVVVSSAAYGEALRCRYNPRLSNFTRLTGPGNTPQRWTAVGVVLESLIHAVTEPNPRIKNPANTNWWYERVVAPPDPESAA